MLIVITQQKIILAKLFNLDRMTVTENIKEKGMIEGQVNCNHCGESCPSDLFRLQEKSFCCSGCLTVYQILHENNLGDFYNIDQKAGLSLKNRKEAKYDWLEEAEIIKQLIDYQDDKQTKITLRLPQIHCASCVWLLEHLNKLNSGVLATKVNFMKREAYISFNQNELQLRELAELLNRIGYAPEIGLEQLNKSDKPLVDRTLIYQIGLAGFAFGNIMLFSFPEYLGLEYGPDAIFRKVFGWLNLALAIPVLLYSGRDYLRSAYHGLRQKNLNIDVPVALGMLTLFGRSAIEIVTETGAGYFDSLAGLVFFLLIGKWFQRQTYNRLTFDRDYESYFPVAATVLKNKKEKSVSLPKLAVGDRILIRHGELIPADGILCSNSAVIDYSFVTGEAEPVIKKAGDLLYAGGKQTKGAFEMVLTKKSAQSYLIRLWNDEAFEDRPSRTELLADKTGRYFTIAILVIAFTTLFYWLQLGEIYTAINAFTAVLIIACPCAVALAIPFTFGTVSRLIAKNKIYIKDTSVIEKIGNANVVVFDKTGTITSPKTNKVAYHGKSLDTSILQGLQVLTRQSGHPLSRKINTWTSEKVDVDTKTSLYNFTEVTGKGIRGEYAGLKYELGNRTFAPIKTKDRKHEHARVFLSINGKFYGSFSFIAEYREGLTKVIDWAKNKGKIYLLSGDNDSEKTYLSPIFGAENLYFSQSPHDKLAFIKKLQKEGNNVLMFGDGLNDAGALRVSDVGIVVSEDTNNFVPACDAVADASIFKSLPSISTFLNSTVKVVYGAYLLAFIYNIVGLSYAVTGTLSPVVAAILMPLSSISVVLFGVLMSRFLFFRVFDKKSPTQSDKSHY